MDVDKGPGTVIVAMKTMVLRSPNRGGRILKEPEIVIGLTLAVQEPRHLASRTVKDKDRDLEEMERISMLYVPMVYVRSLVKSPMLKFAKQVDPTLLVRSMAKKSKTISKKL